MTQEDLTAALTASRVLPVLRARDAETAVAVGRRLHAALIPILEVSWTTPQAADAVRELREVHPLVGAGTIVDAAKAAQAIAAGAQFLVAPNFAPEVGEIAHVHRVPYLPAGYTPSEVYAIWRAGYDVIKLFPAVTGDVAHLRALRDVYPEVRFVPTGGVALGDVPRWIQAGALAVGVGGSLMRLTGAQLAAELETLRAAFAGAVGEVRP